MPSPGTVTLAQIRAQAALRADMGTPTTTSFVTISEWNGYISNSYKELYDILVSAYGADYYAASPYQFTTDGTNGRFSLPADFYKLLGVDIQIAGRFVSIDPFAFSDRNRGGFGTNVPSGGQTVQVFYVPEPTSLASDADSLDGISGWEEYVIVDAAIKAKDKEESDVSVLGAQKQALERRISEMAETRDVGKPYTVVDTARSRGLQSGVRYRLFGNQIWLIQTAIPYGWMDSDGWSDFGGF